MDSKVRKSLAKAFNSGDISKCMDILETKRDELDREVRDIEELMEKFDDIRSDLRLIYMEAGEED